MALRGCLVQTVCTCGHAVLLAHIIIQLTLKHSCTFILLFFFTFVTTRGLDKLIPAEPEAVPGLTEGRLGDEDVDQALRHHGQYQPPPSTTP